MTDFGPINTPASELYRLWAVVPGLGGQGVSAGLWDLAAGRSLQLIYTQVATKWRRLARLLHARTGLEHVVVSEGARTLHLIDHGRTLISYEAIPDEVNSLWPLALVDVDPRNGLQRLLREGELPAQWHRRQATIRLDRALDRLIIEVRLHRSLIRSPQIIRLELHPGSADDRALLAGAFPPERPPRETRSFALGIRLPAPTSWIEARAHLIQIREFMRTAPTGGDTQPR